MKIDIGVIFLSLLLFFVTLFAVFVKGYTKDVKNQDVISNLRLEVESKNAIIVEYDSILVYSEVQYLKYILENPTINTIYIYATEIGVKYPDVMLAQIIIESGWLKYYSHNNFLGFQYKGKNLKYDSWFDCIHTYKAWQLDNRDIESMSKAEYIESLNTMKPIYAADVNYKHKIYKLLVILDILLI